jgi:hypothetical protein
LIEVSDVIDHTAEYPSTCAMTTSSYIFVMVSFAYIAFLSTSVVSYSPRVARFTARNFFQPLSTSVSDDVSVSVITELPLRDTTELIQFSKSLPVHIYVDKEILDFLGMPNSARKARVLLPQSAASMTVKLLRDYVDKKLPSLLGQPYILRYSVPGDGSSPKQFTGKLFLLSITVHV